MYACDSYRHEALEIGVSAAGLELRPRNGAEWPWAMPLYGWSSSFLAGERIGYRGDIGGVRQGARHHQGRRSGPSGELITQVSMRRRSEVEGRGVEEEVCQLV